MNDPYVYPGTSVLKNKKGLQDNERLARFERERSRVRLRNGVPPGDLDIEHLKSMHRHVFQDVYEWAGEFRSVDISKGNSMFCFARYVPQELERITKELKAEKYLQGLTRDRFAERAAYYLSEINAVHPFREGNGRTQRLFIREVAKRAGHQLEMKKMDEKAMLEASIKSMKDKTDEMVVVIRNAMTDEPEKERDTNSLGPKRSDSKERDPKDKSRGRGD